MINTESLLKYANMLVQGDIQCSGIPSIIVQDDRETYRLDCCSDHELTTEDIKNYSGSADLFKSILIRSEYNAMIICKPEWAGRAIDEGINLYPTLDDFAMIVGPMLSLVDRDRTMIERALKFSSAVMIKNGNLICFGHNIYEAYTCLTVLEKNAKIYYKAKVFGGAKYVSVPNTILEHIVYKKKYSKNERSTQNAAEGRD